MTVGLTQFIHRELQQNPQRIAHRRIQVPTQR
jgi:hypothetical protein